MQELTVTAKLDSRYAAIHIEALYEAWRHGLGLWIQELEQDPLRAARVYARAAKFFENLSMDTVEDLSAKLQQAKG